MTTSDPTSSPHPLDPLRVSEVRAASQALAKSLGVVADQIRFKVIDLMEPPKNLVLQFLSGKGPAPDRKARVYFHRRGDHVLSIAVVNISESSVEKVYDAPGSQGPVDWVEFDLVHNACLQHPDVQAEVAKLKLPARYASMHSSFFLRTSIYDCMLTPDFLLVPGF